FLLLRRTPLFPLFPYTTLFRSLLAMIPPVDALSVFCRAQTRPARDLVKSLYRQPSYSGELCEAQFVDGIPMAPRRLIGEAAEHEDRKSTRLNSSHDQISYAVFC